MSLYYFDTYDGDEPVVDDEGLDFADLDTVKLEAVRGLADLARDLLPGSERRELAVIVRDDQSRHILKTVVIFENSDAHLAPGPL